jgi:hypothetical protein
MSVAKGRSQFVIVDRPVALAGQTGGLAGNIVGRRDRRFQLPTGLSAFRPLAVRTHSAFRLDPDGIVDGVANPLLAAKISLCRLHRHVSK